NCRAVGLSFYATLNQTVVDGTPCGAFQPYLTTQNRICVGGNCLLLGCDGLLGSGRTLDSCGICGGNNSTCRLISGVYLRPNLPFGYNLIATLPSGAQNLSIYHTRPSSNYLALREMGGNYILNGPSGMNSSGSFESSGTIFTYSRPHVNGGDHLYARGPTTHSLDVMLFYQMPDPGIKYEYRLVSKSTNHHVSRDNNQLSRDESTSFDSGVPGGSSYNRHSTSGLVNDAITINAIPRNKEISITKKYPPKKEIKLKKENEKKYKTKKQKRRRKREIKRGRRGTTG
ncbi:Thrombospondin type-1 domain-containing protein 4, partial [Armadillidium nasatum]